ncbi:MAG: ABC transporter ATP-binding protein [Candidatus Poribacteria bacterium]|nr:ABC transporter ATP-binding protein [Candidatus Poribacteria bacterium]
MMTNTLVVDRLVKHFHRKKPYPNNGKLTFPQKINHRLKNEKEVVKAVDDVSFRVAMGEIYGILGANGSGKSTLIRLISTLLLPDSGEISFFGYDVVKDSFKFRQMINRVSVEASFFKRLSSEENLVYAARLYGLSAREAREKAEKILVRLGFDSTRMDEMMEDLSRGMQQKIAIARALLTSPILLLLDEPTTGLDPKSKRDVQRFISEIREDNDVVVLLTTHDMVEAETLCDHIAIIDNGKFIATGTPKELKAQVSTQGDQVTLEDVFIELTGTDLAEDVE